MEKLYERVLRYKGQLQSGKLIEVMFEIKTEVEGYTGKKINLESHIDQLEKDAKKSGTKFKPEEMRHIKNMLKKTEKKHNHKALYLAECNMYNIHFDQKECDYLFKAGKHDKKGEKEEVQVPIRMTIGVTASLCGYFLSFIPHPYCQAGSKFLIAVGLEMCIESTVSRVEEKEKQNQERK